MQGEKFMKKFLNKVFNPKKTGLFWLYFVCGALTLIVGIMLMPVWQNCGSWCFYKDWGLQIVNIIIAVCLVLYLALFLVKKISGRSNGVIKVLTIVEFVILALVAIGCILQQFKVINIGGSCAILGLAMWCRGVVEIFRAYYHQKGNNEKYPVWWLVIAVVFVSLGVYLFAKPLFQDVVILWIFVCLILLFGIVLVVDGFLAKPAGKKSVAQKKKNR